MRATPEISPGDGLAKLATYPFAVLTWVEPNGYPLSVAVDATVDPDAGTVDIRTAGRPGGPDGSRGLAHGLAHPPAARLRL